MIINSFTSMPRPANGNGGVVPPDLRDPARNTGVVPEWLQRDLGVHATQVTEPKHRGWYLDPR